MRKSVIVLFCLLISPWLQADNHAEYQQFFEKYQSMADAFDPAMVSLYADDAKIMGVRKKPDGAEESMTISGTRWKTIVASSMDRAKQMNDRSEFSNVTIDVNGGKAKISASRYTTIDCFTDDRFYLVVEKTAADQLQITEQFMESSMNSTCGDETQELADFLARTVKMINEQLPATIDPETQLIKTASEGTRLIYHYILVNHTSDSLSTDEATAKLMPLVLEQSCNGTNLSPVLNQGGSVTFIYKGSDAKQIARLDVDKSNCPE